MNDPSLKFKITLYWYDIVIHNLDYAKPTIKTLATIDQDKINNDLIEELVVWIVSGNHEVCTQ